MKSEGRLVASRLRLELRECADPRTAMLHLMTAV